MAPDRPPLPPEDQPMPPRTARLLPPCLLVALVAPATACFGPSSARPADPPSGPRLLLAAMPGEFAGLDRNPPPGWVCAVTGVGSIKAAVATTRLIHQHRPSEVVMIGTCGTYDGATLPLMSVVGVGAAVSTSPDELRGIIHRPKVVEQTRWAATLATPFPPRTVVVTSGITLDRQAAQLLAREGEVEHMEMAGTLAACQEAGVPCGGVLVVTDQVGPDGRTQYLAHRDEASRRLAQALRDSGLLDARRSAARTADQ